MVSTKPVFPWYTVNSVKFCHYRVYAETTTIVEDAIIPRTTPHIKSGKLQKNYLCGIIPFTKVNMTIWSVVGFLISIFINAQSLVDQTQIPFSQ